MNQLRLWIVVLLMVSVVGCPAPHRKRKPRPVNDDTVIVSSDTATAIHKAIAKTKADIYDKLADAVDSGEVKTVNDCMNFCNPMVDEANDKYVVDIEALREARLGGADDTLPSKAAEVFRLFAKEYRNAAK